MIIESYILITVIKYEEEAQHQFVRITDKVTKIILLYTNAQVHYIFCYFRKSRYAALELNFLRYTVSLTTAKNI